MTPGRPLPAAAAPDEDSASRALVRSARCAYVLSMRLLLATAVMLLCSSASAQSSAADAGVASPPERPSLAEFLKVVNRPVAVAPRSTAGIRVRRDLAYRKERPEL